MVVTKKKKYQKTMWDAGFVNHILIQNQLELLESPLMPLVGFDSVCEVGHQY